MYIPQHLVRISPAPLCDLATKVSSKKEGKSEEDVFREFSDKLTFSESSIRELEKASRGQSKPDVWKRQHKGRITASHFHDVNAKVKKNNEKNRPISEMQCLHFLAKLLLPADISELPSIAWGCMHKEDAAMEYKCPYAVRGMLISEVWSQVEYLEMHEGKLELKRWHRYYTQIAGDMAISGLERLLFVVWTGKGIHLLNLCILKQSSGKKFFQTYLQRVILGFIPHCPLYDSLCLEPEEFDKLNNCNENSLQCKSCSPWYHWGC